MLLFVLVSCIIVVAIGIDKKHKQRAEMEDYAMKVKALESTNWSITNLYETKVIREEVSKETVDNIKSDILSTIPTYSPYATDCLILKNDNEVSIDCKNIN